jgi:hypothetical protein
MTVIVFQPLYLVVVGGVVMFLLLVFQTLLGLRVIKFKGALHRKVHRYVSFALIALALVHGTYALGTVVFGWF